MKIFLSHQSRDKALVREFSQQLPTFLAKWIDEESLTWGGSLKTSLQSAIQVESDFLVIFLAETTTESRWVCQELDWAMERERFLGRPFVLPILLGDFDITSLPPELRDRLGLRLSDYSKASVQALAKKATDSLFQLVVESYLTLQHTLRRARSATNVTKRQKQILEYVANNPRVSSKRIADAFGYDRYSSELFYRLENLVLQRLLEGYVVATDGTKAYCVTPEYDHFKDKG